MAEDFPTYKLWFRTDGGVPFQATITGLEDVKVGEDGEIEYTLTGCLYDERVVRYQY